MKCLVLDAMGVIFQAADDVAELLIPFIAEKTGKANKEIVRSAYLDASLGKISADNFWSQVNVAPEFEDSYLSRHSLLPGVSVIFSYANENDIPVWCLSNDVSRWSEKLRNYFRIDELLTGSVISGDIGIRKPDRGIYEVLVQRCGYEIEELLFVDDREKNVQAAREFGIETILFNPATGFEDIQNRISQGDL
jgi:putative hydrolase of the HAD superfamily